jgi:hypothetical protein
VCLVTHEYTQRGSAAQTRRKVHGAADGASFALNGAVARVRIVEGGTRQLEIVLSDKPLTCATASLASTQKVVVPQAITRPAPAELDRPDAWKPERRPAIFSWVAKKAKSGAPYARANIERMLRRGSSELPRALLAIPEDEDFDAIAAILLDLLEKNPRFGASCRVLPKPLIEAALSQIDARVAAPWLAFVRARVGDADHLVVAWTAAIDALLPMVEISETKFIGPREAAALHASLADDPRSLEATRAVVASRSELVPWPLLAVLALDNDEASVDALLPTLERAIATRDPTLRQFLGLAARSSDHVKRILGYTPPPAFDRDDCLRILFGNDVPNTVNAGLGLSSGPSDSPRLQLSFLVDSDRRTLFQLRIHDALHDGWTEFEGGDDVLNHDDSIGLGAAGFAELPRYVARVAEEFGVAWNCDTLNVRTNLVTTQRRRLIGWLRGGD